MALFMGVVSGHAGAQLPLSVEQLQVETSRWQWVTVFGQSGQRESADHEFRQSSVTTALRYGAWRGGEINARLRRADVYRRAAQFAERTQVQSISAGINWLVKAETASPAVLLEARAELLSRQGDREETFSAGELRFTGYKSVDPLVLSLNGGVKLRTAYQLDGQRVQPGHSWWLTPQVNFAVNGQVTLIGGLSYQQQLPAIVAGATVSDRRQRIGYRAGVAYAPDRRNSLFMTGDFSADAGGGALSLQWNYQF
jgi:hypothetical protein